MSILFQNVTAVLMDEARTVLRDGYVAVKGTEITYVGQQRPGGSFNKVINCEGKVMMPGFVNAHTHVPMTLMRGFGGGCDLHKVGAYRRLPLFCLRYGSEETGSDSCHLTFLGKLGGNRSGHGIAGRKPGADLQSLWYKAGRFHCKASGEAGTGKDRHQGEENEDRRSESNNGGRRRCDGRILQY